MIKSYLIIQNYYGYIEVPKTDFLDNFVYV